MAKKQSTSKPAPKKASTKALAKAEKPIKAKAPKAPVAAPEPIVAEVVAAPKAVEKAPPKPKAKVYKEGVRYFITTMGGEELIGTIKNGVVYRNVVRGGCQCEDALYEGPGDLKSIREATLDEIRPLKVMYPRPEPLAK